MSLRWTERLFLIGAIAAILAIIFIHGVEQQLTLGALAIWMLWVLMRKIRQLAVSAVAALFSSHLEDRSHMGPTSPEETGQSE